MIYSIIDWGTIVEGFNTKYGQDVHDVHFWCEDDFGNIYDPTPSSKHPSGGSDYVYIQWDNQSKCMKEYSEPAWSDLMRHNKVKDTQTNREYLMNDIWLDERANRALNCHINSYTLAFRSPCEKTNYRKVKVCVGSYGYKCDAGLIEINWGQ